MSGRDIFLLEIVEEGLVCDGADGLLLRALAVLHLRERVVVFLDVDVGHRARVHESHELAEADLLLALARLKHLPYREEHHDEQDPTAEASCAIASRQPRRLETGGAMRHAITINLVLRMRNIEVSSLPLWEKTALLGIKLAFGLSHASSRQAEWRVSHHISAESEPSEDARSIDASSAMRQRCSTTRGLIASRDGSRSRRTTFRRNLGSALEGS